MSLLRFMAVVPALLFTSLVAKADFVFVGSWDVFRLDAPLWSDSPPTGPLAYTGQEAAALLFGGTPDDYAISTEGDEVSAINFSAWYDVIGAGGAMFAHDYSNKYLDSFYGPTSGFSLGPDALLTNAASAFIRDNLFNAGAVNYAFRMQRETNVVPDMASTWLLVLGSGSVLAVLRRRLTA